jgi:uncharacterized membrane protein YqjE
MMELLGRLGVAVIELLEAEARSLKSSVVRLAVAAGLAVLFLCLALLGLGFLVAGVYLCLTQWMPPGEAALLVSVSSLAVASGGILVLRHYLS